MEETLAKKRSTAPKKGRRKDQGVKEGGLKNEEVISISYPVPGAPVRLS